MNACICVVLILVSPLLSSGLNPELDSLWHDYKIQFKKEYSSKREEKYRRDVFENHAKIIEDHNKNFDLGLTTYKLGLNEFADLSNAEFRTLFFGYLKKSKLPIANALHSNENILPRRIDWREKGDVTPVRNQGSIGDVLTFAIAGAVESALAIKTGRLITLSLQQIHDCCTVCSSVPTDMYECVLKMRGIDGDDCYSFKTCNTSCTYDPKCSGAGVTSFYHVKSGDELAMQKTLAESGPVSVSIDASSIQFQLYRSGIYDNPDCSSIMLDHAVVVVGYDDDGNGHDFWIVKNSWGTSWGMNGYINMSRNKNNQCGIATDANFPVVEGDKIWNNKI